MNKEIYIVMLDGGVMHKRLCIIPVKLQLYSLRIHTIEK